MVFLGGGGRAKWLREREGGIRVKGGRGNLAPEAAFGRASIYLFFVLVVFWVDWRWEWEWEWGEFGDECVFFCFFFWD